MMNLLLVAVGGAIGAGARFALGTMFSPSADFPWSTLIINLTGGLLMGFLVGLLMRYGANEPLRLLLGVGVLGGFTTFSAFGLETLTLIEHGEVFPALAYVAASVGGAVALTGVGIAVARAA